MKFKLGSVFCLLSCIVNAQQVLVLGNESMPFNGIVNGKPAGINYEILEQVSLHGGPKFEYRFGLPWKRAQIKVQQASNALTAIVPLTRTPEREAHYVWVTKLLTHQARVSIYNQPNVTILEQVLDNDVGIIQESALLPMLRARGFNQLIYSPNALVNAKLLKHGRVFAVVESQYVDTYHWGALGYRIQDLHFIPVGRAQPIFLGGNLRFPIDVKRRIDDAMIKIQQNGTLQRILTKWETTPPIEK